MLRSMPEFEKLPGVPLDLFLSGAHYFKTEGSPEGAQVAAFDEACRHCASLLGVRGACEAAASLAEMAQHAQQDRRGQPRMSFERAGLMKFGEQGLALAFALRWELHWLPALAPGALQATSLENWVEQGRQVWWPHGHCDPHR
eukprot:g19617.t1